MALKAEGHKFASALVSFKISRELYREENMTPANKFKGVSEVQFALDSRGNHGPSPFPGSERV